MSEPYAFQITVEQDFDGQTTMTQTIGAFLRQGGRHYKLRTPGPAGVIASDFFGLFSTASPKLVGVATRSLNSRAKAWVVAEGSTRALYREQLNLEPRFQHVAMFPGDHLELVTRDGGAVTVDILVNDMSESEHVAYALRQRPYARPRRFRIVRTDGAGFSPAFDAEPWYPAFLWDESTEVLTAVDNNHGPLSLRALGIEPRAAECLVTVRYLNIAGAGKLHVLDRLLNVHAGLQPDIESMKWSKVQFISHQDHLVFESPGPAGGASVVADIEVVQIRPADRLQGRFDRGS